MNPEIKQLFALTGSYEGYGVNHEGQRFKGVLELTPRFEGKGLTLDFSATGDDGAVFHNEHSILGMTPGDGVALFVLSTNHPGVVEHRLDASDASGGATASFRFTYGSLDDRASFREVISLDLWPNGELGYRYAWGLPGGDFAERSSVRMTHGSRRKIPEAKLVPSETGLVPDGDGWFVLNAKDARWQQSAKFGESVGFEGNVRFRQYGINIHVLEPGQPNCHYHGEDDQEDFLVLSGSCKLLIEGEERELRAWDFVHCPKWTKHVFVGSGTEPCAILMTGGRNGDGVIYPAIELAKKYSAAPEADTDSPKISYVDCPKWVPTRGSWITTRS